MKTLVKVLKDFPYGEDGIHSVTLFGGEQHEIHDELLDGLIGEGFVERPKEGGKKPAPAQPLGAPENGAGKPPETKGADGDGVPDPAAPVAIPDDWKSLQFMSLKALANKFDPAAAKKPECIAAIEAELARRAA